MRLEEIYPYWGRLHQQLLETLEFVTADLLEYRPSPVSDNIADVVLRLIREERWWIGTLIAGFDEYRPLEKDHRTTGQLIESLKVTREITERVVAAIPPEGLRAVRAVPADPTANRPETNMPVTRLIWQALENEIAAWGRINQRLEDAKLARPQRDVRRN